ncbi:hypothetical protein FQA39_LY09804 [Lamprigera yunnana]|nr:hypothetical protein FQA39_LY09804 [Lamprigera yunnana]
MSECMTDEELLLPERKEEDEIKVDPMCHTKGWICIVHFPKRFDPQVEDKSEVEIDEVVTKLAQPEQVIFLSLHLNLIL